MALLVWATWYPLHPLGQDRYRVEGQPLTLEFRDAAAGRELVEHWDGRGSAPAFRRDDRTGTRTGASMTEYSEYADTYMSPDLNASWRVSPRNGGLVSRAASRTWRSLSRVGGICSATQMGTHWSPSAGMPQVA